MEFSYQKKADRRSNKTIAVIYDTFIHCLMKKHFDAISVKLVCETAQINRSTFYDHFTDKYHLLECILADMVYECSKNARALPIGNENPTPKKMLETGKTYAVVLREIFINNSDKKLIPLFHKVVAKDLKKQIRSYLQCKNEETPIWLDFTAEFYTGSITSAMVWWLHHMDTVPFEEVLYYMQTLLDTMYEKSEFFSEKPLPDFSKE